MRNRTLWIALLGVFILTGLAWWQHKAVLAWHHVRQLSYAYEDRRDALAEKVASLGEAALPRVLDGLCNDDALICGNMQAVLSRLANRWGPTDSRSVQMVEDLCRQFNRFSLAGQEKSLLFLTTYLQQEREKPWPASVTKEIGERMVIAEQQQALRGASLLLAAELVDCVQPGQWVDPCREMAERGMKDAQQGTRVAAVQLLLRAPMRKDKELMAKIVPLLSDPAFVVRRVAVLALAPETDVVREDAFMPMLHDADGEVQHLCEQALRTRGLTDDDIQLARLISDRNPANRMRVLQYLPQMPDLNLAEWLRQLSQDPVPAVRAAAVRAAGENPSVDLSPRLREMAEADPSETVRMNALYYLRHRTSLRASVDR